MTARAPAATFWPTAARTALPAASELPAFLNSVEFLVPERTKGRTKAHREGHCIIRALRWLGTTHPHLFPATLIRQEAPDFVLEPIGNGQTWAIEHTDAGEEDLQKWLRNSELGIAPCAVPDRGGRLREGDAADVLFAREIGRAIGAKIAKDSFRFAPAGALRCVLMYAHSRFVVDVTAARCALAAALAALRAAGASIDAAQLLFSREVNGEAVMDLVFVPAEEPTP